MFLKEHNEDTGGQGCREEVRRRSPWALHEPAAGIFGKSSRSDGIGRSSGERTLENNGGVQGSVLCPIPACCRLQSPRPYAQKPPASRCPAWEWCPFLARWTCLSLSEHTPVPQVPSRPLLPLSSHLSGLIRVPLVGGKPSSTALGTHIGHFLPSLNYFYLHIHFRGAWRVYIGK